MNGKNDKTSSQGLLHVVADWWREARDRWSRLDELHRLSSVEIDRMAQECGMSQVDFLRTAGQSEGTVLLLERRLEALRITPEQVRAISPLLLADLQRTCCACPDKSRCSADMKVDPLAAGWESYCPNSGTLRTLV